MPEAVVLVQLQTPLRFALVLSVFRQKLGRVGLHQAVHLRTVTDVTSRLKYLPKPKQSSYMVNHIEW